MRRRKGWNVCICIFWFKGTSTSKAIGAHNEMIMDDYDGQMTFGDLVGLKQGSSTRGPRAACGPPASFERPGKGISQNTMRYEY